MDARRIQNSDIGGIMAETQNIIDYYKNLLIIQYNQKTKAQQTIALMVSEMLANGVMFDVMEGYDLETAVGTQLDILGKYIGVDRFYEYQELFDYFGLVEYDEDDPDAERKYGFSTYATFDDDALNGTITYDSILTQTNSLNDDDYRILLKLKIIQNNINHSYKEINDGVFEIFGDTVRPSSTGDMHMYYFIANQFSAVVLATLNKNLLPRPMGVGLTIITDADEPFFGFASYTNTPTHILGFTTYAEYDNSTGNTLVYDNLETV